MKKIINKLNTILSITVSISYFFTVSSIYPLSIDKISPTTIFPTTNVQPQPWFGDVFLIVSDVNDTLISSDCPVDKSGVIDAINELLDLGVVFCPLTGLGLNRLNEALLSYIPEDRRKGIIAGTQKGGIISDLGTGEKIGQESFPETIKKRLHSIVRTHINEILLQEGHAREEWYFQPQEPDRLRSILFISFTQREGIENILPGIAQRLQERLKADPALKGYLVDGKLPFSITTTGRHIEVSVVSKADVIKKIVEYVSGNKKPRGNTVVVIGNSGGETGNDAQMLNLKKIGDIPVKSVYAGNDDQDWAHSAGISIIPKDAGPAGVIEFLRSVALAIKKDLRQKLVSNITWQDIKPAIQKILSEELANTDMLDKTLSRFDLGLNDISDISIFPLGAGNESYVCAISFNVKPERRTKVEGLGSANGIINVSAVISHSTYDKNMKLDSAVHLFLRHLKMARLRNLTEIAGDITDKPFPNLLSEGENVYTREWLEGTEIGDVINKLGTDNKEALAKLLQEASRSVIDFWNRVTNRKWFPMVHDDDILVRQTSAGRFIATLPDLDTPIYRSPGIRVLNEMVYLSYELVQIFYEKAYSRHSLLNSMDVQMILYSVFNGVLEALGEEEGREFFYNIIYYCQTLVIPLREATFYHYHYPIGYTLRAHVEKFLSEKGIPLPDISYERPEESLILNWRNTTELVDKLRRYIPIEERRRIPALTLPRPYDDRTLDEIHEAGSPGLLSQYKSNAKTFNRLGEIILGIKNIDIKILLSIFPKGTYTYQFLGKLYSAGRVKIYIEDYPELLFALAKDFNLTDWTIPSDWIRLYRLIYYDASLKENPPPKINFYTSIPNSSGQEIELRINEDLGKHSLLWHPTNNMQKIFSFDVYIDGKNCGIIAFSIINNTLVLEQVRLSKRRAGVGTALMNWLKIFMEDNGIEYVVTFDFVHFILIHVLDKVFDNLEVFGEGQWRRLSQEEAQKLAIDNPTGYVYRAKTAIAPRAANPIDPEPAGATVRASA